MSSSVVSLIIALLIVTYITHLRASVYTHEEYASLGDFMQSLISFAQSRYSGLIFFTLSWLFLIGVFIIESLKILHSISTLRLK